MPLRIKLYKKYLFFIRWFVHKRNTLQNIPIWEHKQSSSVILSYTPFWIEKKEE